MTPPRHRSTPTGAGSLRRRSLLAGMGAVPLVAATPAAARALRSPSPTQAEELIVDPTAERQTILGFGGMNHTVWISDLTADQRETAFGNDADSQLGFTVLRIPVHENPADWQGEVATAVRASELGARVIASPWNPPSQMVEDFGGGRRLRYDSYGAYAQHLNDFYEFMRGNGVDLYGISVQNEPDYAHEWTAWTAEEIVTFLRENAGDIGTRVIAPESFQYVKSMSDPILSDSQALANLDILGAHLYGTPFDQFSYPLFEQVGQGKELWMTEVYYPDSTSDADSWPQALDVGEHVHRALVDGQFQTYVWWYIRRSYGPMREDGQMSKRGANMAHFSKFVRPGHVRLEVTASPQQNVYTSAYKGEDSRIVIVAINKNSSAVTLPVTLQDTAASTVAAWRTDAGANLAPQDAISVTDGSFTGELPAQSVTTFVTE